MSYIDYGQELSELEPTKKWSSKELQAHWKKLYVKYHKGGGISWTIKDITLLKRVIEEYGNEIIARMMQVWMETTLPELAYSFVNFYNKRELVFQRMNSSNEDWSWQ